MNHTMGTLRKFRSIARFLKGSSHFLVLALAAGMLNTMFNALTPQIIRHTVDALTGEGGYPGTRFLLLAAAAAVCLVKKKWSRKAVLPMTPFLTAGFVILLAGEYFRA